MTENYKSLRVAGLLLLIGAFQNIIVISIAEALSDNTLDRGYSVARNVISDLGVGPTALLFNTSVFLFGVLFLLAGYMIFLAFRDRILLALFFLTGIGDLGVGLFPETMLLPHSISAFFIFVFGGLVAIKAYKVEKPPLNYLSILIGMFSLATLFFFSMGIYLGLGIGGMERMIVYPTLIWTVAFGGYLIGSKEIAQ